MSIQSPTPPRPAQSAFEAEQPTFPITRPDYTLEPSPEQKRTARWRRRKNLALGLGFLAPNILGFLTFTAVPLVISMFMAFTNWELALHNNPEGGEELRWVGFAHFARLFSQPDFWKYLGNTLFFMMAMPFGIAASLGAAMLLSKDLRGGHRKVWLSLLAGAVLVASVLLLTAVGAGGTGMALLIAGLAGMVLVIGVMGGTTTYRTLFYVPHFTAGVATFLLWKKLFNPTTGPITNAVQPVLNVIETGVKATPSLLVQSLFGVCIAFMLLVLVWGLKRIRQYWEEGDLGWAGALLSIFVLLIPVLCMINWYGNPAQSLVEWMKTPHGWTSAAAIVAVLAAGGYQLFCAAGADKQFVVSRPWHGVGTGLMFAAFAMVLMFVLIGLGPVFYNLPAWSWASEGLKTPQWLQNVHWAKPSLMLMGFWGAIGSNTMLLYLAALTNVPQELYEAADIDGATRFQKFWNVTWPQLAPTTFFIVVMGVIGGLQGGFEMVRVMTSPPGGPAGTTTTLAYFIYTEGFETGRLGYSSAVAWSLFLMVLIVTLFNWKFGNKYVND
jgi:multiple sugar transport system permease protein